MAKLIDIDADGWVGSWCILVIIHDSQEASCPHFFLQAGDCWLQSCREQLYHLFGTFTNPASARDTWSGAVLNVDIFDRVSFGKNCIFFENQKNKKRNAWMYGV